MTRTGVNCALLFVILTLCGCFGWLRPDLPEAECDTIGCTIKTWGKYGAAVCTLGLILSCILFTKLGIQPVIYAACGLGGSIFAYYLGTYLGFFLLAIAVCVSAVVYWKRKQIKDKVEDEIEEILGIEEKDG